MARPKRTDPAPIQDEVLDAVEAHEPNVSRLPPSGRKFPCSGCGARLDFNPSLRSLKCPYCGAVEEIAPDSTGVQERDWEAYLKKFGAGKSVIEGRSSEVKCGGCGAVILLEDRVVTERCPYCATHLENKPESAHAMVEPEGILPFRVDNRKAVAAFDNWVSGRWFVPTGFKQFANLGKLNGVYLPYWTYDSMTYSRYSGDRGDNYTVTETYTEMENGQMVTKTRQVVHIRWRRVTGEVQHFFDDVLICGSRSLPDGLLKTLTPWHLEKLEGFRPEFLSSFTTERYAVGPKEGLEMAKQIMDAHIRNLCTRDIGGDHQRLHNVRTQHVGVTFKHLLLPVWVAAYRFKDQPYQVVINGWTGEVAGTRPYSVWKILLLAAGITAAIMGLLFLVMMFAR